MFLEVGESRQLRVKGDWENLRKGKSTALVFGAEWVKALAAMKEVGLPPLEDGLGLDYLTKIGEADAKMIRKDRRDYPTADGGKENRTPKTWQEMHAILIEHENITTSQKAINAARQGGQRQENPSGGIGKGREPKPKGLGKGENVTPEKGTTKPVCEQFKRTG